MRLLKRVVIALLLLLGVLFIYEGFGFEFRILDFAFTNAYGNPCRHCVDRGRGIGCSILADARLKGRAPGCRSGAAAEPRVGRSPAGPS